jgi:hypothetical protein
LFSPAITADYLKKSMLADVMYMKLNEWKKKTSAQDPEPNPDYDEQNKNKPGKGETRIVTDPYK